TSYAPYTTPVFSVTTTGSHTLEFKGLSAGDNTAFIDKVVIAPGLDGTFTFTQPPDTVLDAGSQQVRVTFTPSATAHYNSVNADVMLTVAKASPTFSDLLLPSIVYGTATTTLTGPLGAGSVLPPEGAAVDVTLNGVTQQAALDASGDFSTAFATATLGAG